ncbi:MAG TPA: nucleotidyltransferase domain-containing protein, partial [Terriglobales bacterium]|nr:nucleotidyltransferase domain-containing protein [Terriglobales bacterium]
MIPTNTIDEFVKRLRDAGGANVESIILFGSAVAGDFHEGLSNLNLLCILGDATFKSLQALSPAAKWWDKQKQPPPLCMTRQEL